MLEPLPAPGEIALKIAFVFSIVLANAFFVASEFALVSVRRTRVDQLAADGNSSALALQGALKQIDRYIAAVQVGVTLASLMLGSLGEQTLQPLFAHLLAGIGMPEVLIGITRAAVATVLAYFIMTVFTVVIGELMPKAVTLQKSETVALLTIRPMVLFVKLVTPMVWLLNGIGGFLLRAFGIKNFDEGAQVHSPEELDLLFAQSHDAGELTKTEFEILHRVVKFSDLTAREVMVPRVEMKALPVTMTSGELRAYLHNQPHTRVPVFHGSLDEIVGITHLKDLLKLLAAAPPDDAPINLMTCVRDAARVPETITIDRLLVEFKRRRQQMAVVIDEYGGTSGIVTMGDLLEQAFGDVHDEFDRPEPELQKLPDGRLRLSGRVRIEEVNERFGTGFPTDDADTMAGLVLDALGRVAAVGDSVEVCGAKLLVEAVEKQRIVTILLQLSPEQSRDNRSDTAAAA
jgi:CBS domain containing-hemolysin-like protein